MTMSYSRAPARGAQVQRMGGSSSLADVLNIILDKGIVIDAWARISVIGIELITIEARVVVASVETYLQYAEAIGLTALAAPPQGDQGGQQRKMQPSEDRVLAYISDRSEGARLGELEAYFDASREDLSNILNQLADQGKVRRDEEHKLYLPAGQKQ